MHADFLGKSIIILLLYQTLQILLQIMPAGNKLLISLQIRCINPFFDLYLRPVLCLTFMYLKNIVETTVFVISSKRKYPAEPWSESVDTASAFFI